MQQSDFDASEDELFKFVIYLDTKVPNFVNEYSFEPDLWPSNEIFDYINWRANKDACNKIIKANENKVVKFNEGL